jgi:hypothetical protein
MSKKDRQYNIKEGQTIQCQRRTDNTISKKDRQYNVKEGQTI